MKRKVKSIVFSRDMLVIVPAILSIMFLLYFDITSIGIMGVFGFWWCIYSVFVKKENYFFLFILASIYLIIFLAVYFILLIYKLDYLDVSEYFYIVYAISLIASIVFFWVIFDKKLAGLPTQVFGWPRIFAQFAIFIPVFVLSPKLLSLYFIPAYSAFQAPADLTSSTAKAYFLFGDGSTPATFIFPCFLLFHFFSPAVYGAFRNCMRTFRR